MNKKDYIPTRDEDLSTFAQNFSALITATPAVFSLLPADATALAALVTEFTEALETALNPSTRTPVAVAAKDTARVVLVADIRSLAKRIQSAPNVTPAQKTSLGLTVQDHVRTPVPPPATKPVVNVVTNGGRRQTIRLVDETTPLKRARPVGVAGAEVYSYVQTSAEAPPADLEAWRFEGLATRSEFEIGYNSADVGKTAHIRALWYNAKGQSGPESDEVIVPIAA